MAGTPAGMETLQRLLPGGTFITFTVLAQLTTSAGDISKGLARCQSLKDAGLPHKQQCKPQTVCGDTGFALTVALVVVTAVICMVLGWWNASIDAKEAKTLQQEIQHRIKCMEQHAKQTAEAAEAASTETKKTLAEIQHTAINMKNLTAPGASATPADPVSAAAAANQQRLGNSMSKEKPSSGAASNQAGAQAAAADTPDPLQSPALDGRDKSPARAFLEQVIRTLGGTAIFLVLALFTPPVSTCLLPEVHKTVITVVPLLVAFFVSGLLVVLDRLLDSLLKIGAPCGGVIFCCCCYGPVTVIRSLLKTCLPMADSDIDKLSTQLGKTWRSSQNTLYGLLHTAPPHYCADQNCRGSAQLTCCDWCGRHWHKGCAYPADCMIEPSGGSNSPAGGGAASAAAGDAALAAAVTRMDRACQASDQVPQPPGGWLCPKCNINENFKVVSEGLALHAKWVLGAINEGQIRLLPEGKMAIQFADYFQGQQVEQYETPEQLRKTFEVAQQPTHSKVPPTIVEHCPTQELWDRFRRKGWLQMPRAVLPPPTPSVSATGAATEGVSAVGAAMPSVPGAGTTSSGNKPAAGGTTAGVPVARVGEQQTGDTAGAGEQQAGDTAAASSMLRPPTDAELKSESQLTGAATGMAPEDSNEIQPSELNHQSTPPTPAPSMEQPLQPAAAAATPPGPDRAAPNAQGQDVEVPTLKNLVSVTKSV